MAALDLPFSILTRFGGRSGAAAPTVPGMSALAELTGPGLPEPIELRTQPGQPFALPPLHVESDYVLQNIRLGGSDGAFLQPCVPSILKIAARNALQSAVRIHQLTPDELRARGIHIDERSYAGYVRSTGSVSRLAQQRPMPRRRHSGRLSSPAASLFLEDLGSKNGTSLHGQQIHSPRDLRDGDRIVFGTVAAIFRAVRPATTTDTAGR